MTELDDVYNSADHNYRESLRLLGETVSLVQDFVDLYQRMSDTVAGSPLAARDDHVMGVKFLLGARYYLITGVADCLRCHLTDSFWKTRMAIEHVAFAARVKRHPHLAKVWLEAGEDETSYDEYREKFKKLFPSDHPRLLELGGRYDMCAKQSHPSIYAFASRSSVEETERFFNLKFDYFQAQRDGSEPIRTFFFHVTTHMLIANLFREVLADGLAGDAKAIEVRANAAEGKYAAHRNAWLQLIPSLVPPDVKA